MKIWIKSLIAIVISLLIGFLVPTNWTFATDAFDFLATISLSFMRYFLFPLLFFATAIRVFDLQKQRQLGKTLRISLSFFASTALIFSIIGACLALLVKKIPINSLKQDQNLDIPSFKSLICSIFPENLFSVFTTDGSLLIPLVIFSFIIGISLNYDKMATRPIAELFDAFASLFQHINIFFSEISVFPFIFVTTASIFELRRSNDLVLFTQFFVLLTVVSLVLIFAIYPFLLFVIAKQRNPYKIIFGMLTPLVAAFISGNIFFATPLVVLHNEKNLGIKPHLNMPLTSLATIFGRAGTALVCSTATIFLLSSYTTYISFGRFVLVIALAFLFSFFTGSFHKSSVIATIALIFTVLGTNRNEYLNLIQVAPLLYFFAALIDCANNTIISYITAHFIDENRDRLLKELL